MDTYQKKRLVTEVFLTLVLAFGLSYSWAYRSELLDLDVTYLTVGIAEGRFAVDTPMAHYGVPLDSVRVDNNTYLKVLPGLAYVASVPFRVVEDAAALPPLKDLTAFLRRFVAIPLTLLGFLGFRRLLRTQLVDEPVIDVVSVAVFFGTPMFWAGRYLSVDAFLACLLAAAMWALHTLESRPMSPAKGTLVGFGAGCAMGWATISHPLGWLVAVMVFLYGVSGPIRYHRPSMMAMLLAIGGGIALWGYLGNVLVGGAIGLQIADRWETGLITDFLSLEHGMLAAAPVLWLTVLGIPSLWQARPRRRAVFYGLAPLILLFAAYFALPDPYGVLPVVAVLMGVGVAAAIDAAQMPATFGIYRGLAACAVVTSVLTVGVLGLTPQMLEDPYWSLLAASVSAEVFAPNLLGQFGMKGLVTVIPVASLALLMAAFVLLRGVTDVGARGRQITAGVIAVVVLAVSLGVVTKAGGYWTPQREKAVMKKIDPLNKHQRGMKQGMDQVIRDVGSMK
ncbi:MAG: hypothetical protein R3E66_16880 [bacterium]